MDSAKRLMEAYLSFSRCWLATSRSADAFSVDSLLCRARYRNRKASLNYGWPIRLVCSIYVLMFFAAAISKLRNSGIGWGLHSLTDIFYQFRFIVCGWGGISSPRACSTSRAASRNSANDHCPFADGHAAHHFYTMDLDFRPSFSLIPFFVPWTGLWRVLSEKVRLVCLRFKRKIRTEN